MAQSLYVCWTHLCDKKFKSSHQTFSTRECGQLDTRLIKYVWVGNGKQSINLEWSNQEGGGCILQALTANQLRMSGDSILSSIIYLLILYAISPIEKSAIISKLHSY